MDGGWLLLAAVALRSPGAWPFAVLLLVSWFLSYLSIFEARMRIDAYAVSLVFDVWATVCGLLILIMDRKARKPATVVVVLLWGLWLGVQAAYWMNYRLGADWGPFAYLAGRLIFTAQMAAVASAGAWCFWLEAHGRHRRLKRLERK